MFTESIFVSFRFSTAVFRFYKEVPYFRGRSHMFRKIIKYDHKLCMKVRNAFVMCSFASAPSFCVNGAQLYSFSVMHVPNTRWTFAC